MRKVLCVIAVLALVATASATVRAFVTGSDGPAGLTDKSTAFIPTYGTVLPNGQHTGGYDYYYHKLAAAPPQTAPSGTLASPIDIQVSSGEFAYIWFQWQAEPISKVNGLKIEIRNEPSGTLASLHTCYYVQDNRNSFVAGTNFSRWDGTATPPGYPEWVDNNPQTMVGVDAQGIKNESATPAAGFNWDMYSWQAGGTKANPLVTGVSLIGAVEVGLGLYSIHITDISYSAGALPDYSSVGYFENVIPEPAGLLLMALAGLLLRRR